MLASRDMKLLVAYGATPAWSLPGDGLEVRYCGATAREIEDSIDAGTEVLVTDALPGRVECCPGLRWIHLMSAGYNQAIGHPLSMRPGLRFSNAAGICAGHMAEFAVGQMLRHVKRFDDFTAVQQSRIWPDRMAMAAPALRGRRALIVGYGGVGRETARLLHALGVEVDAVQRTAERENYRGYVPEPGMGDPAGLLPRRLFTLDSMARAMAGADFVILTIPLTPQTRNLIDQPIFSAMKPGTVLINLARGNLIEMPALEAALAAGRVARAYLDVFAIEPLPPESSLWSHPGITVTPHMSGVMPAAAKLQEDLLRQNLLRFRAGERLLNEINPARLAL